MSIRTLSIGLLLASSIAFADAPLYKIENMGVVPGYISWDYWVTDINNNGDIVGFTQTAGSATYAIIYTPENGFETLPISSAGAINDSRQIAGMNGVVTDQGTLMDYTTGEKVAIGTLLGPDSSAQDINEAGTIVGNAALNTISRGWYERHAVSFKRGSLNDLGTLGGDQATAVAINNNDWIVGQSRVSLTTFDQHAFVKKKNGPLVDMGTLGGPYSSASDINDANQIVGQANTVVANQDHAYLYENNVMQDLGTLGGEDSGAAAINSAGVIVGSSQGADGYYAPFVWVDGVMYDLRKRIVNLADWSNLQGAIDINESGVIIGRGRYYGDDAPSGGYYRIYRLTPITAVAVDVLPGDENNVVYPTRVGKLPVAVLSSPEFDATQVDPNSLRFGLGETAPTNAPTIIADVDGQHGDDTQVRFRVDKSGIFCDDTEVNLYGETFAGESIAGTDQIDASNCEAGGCHVY
jgi:probable HAF family extracellular repeat protein